MASAAVCLLTELLQVFMLLMTEMALFMGLILPMPFSVRRKIFTYVVPMPPLRPLLLTTRRQLHLGEQARREVTIWIENYLHIHIDSVH